MILNFLPSNKKIYLLFLLSLILLSACSPTRRLDTGQQLFVGAELEFVKPTAVKNKKLVEEELLYQVRPQSNSPFKLWIYNLFKEPKKQKGFKHWMKYKVGEAPVLFNYSTVNRSKLVMEKYLQDLGYLDAKVSMDTVDQGASVKAIYKVQSKKRYYINRLYLPEGDTVLDSLTREYQAKSFIKEGNLYKTEDLAAERIRLAEVVTENGYFGLNQNDIYFYVDTAQYVDSLDLYLKWKPSNDSVRLAPYQLGTTTIYSTYSLDKEVGKTIDTVQYQGLKILENYYYVKNKLLRRAIKGQQDDWYDGRLQSSSIGFLQDLEIFKFINLTFEKRTENGKSYLDRSYYLTPAQVRSFRVDFETNTRSGSYFGILGAVNYINKNWLGGAERLDLSFSLGGETQVGNTSSDQFINTLEGTLTASVSVPRLLIPFKPRKYYQNYVPRTRFTLSNAYQIRTGFFSINQFTASAAYDWRSSKRVHHLLTPISINQIQTFNITDDFQVQLDENLRLKNSFENVFILGGIYRLIYSTQEANKLQPYFYFSGTFESAGNIPYLFAKTLGGNQSRHTILGNPFSQFIKLNTDFRYYLQRRTHTWAFRFTSGIIAPYGNSTIAPYTKQFFIGGSSSLRAFRLRELGPGNYINSNLSENNIDFFDQTGDIKIELNAEYRFDIASYFKGAAFLDAGNIWLLNQTIGDNQEGEFKLNQFYKEIALGAGLGFRIDFEYFVVRLDAAFPLRKPVANTGFTWTFDQLDFLNRDWRAENIAWHLAIGYPF